MSSGALKGSLPDGRFDVPTPPAHPSTPALPHDGRIVGASSLNGPAPTANRSARAVRPRGWSVHLG